MMRCWRLKTVRMGTWTFTSKRTGIGMIKQGMERNYEIMTLHQEHRAFWPTCIMQERKASNGLDDLMR
jgi:hypothetical protein